MKKFLLAIILFSTFGQIAFAQSDEQAHTNIEHEFKHFRIAAGIGHGYIPSANSSKENFLIIPTFGFDLQYWVNPKWGIGFKSDIEIANYVVEGEEGDPNAIEREKPTIFALPIFFSPWENGLSFMIGPGIEIEQNHNFSVVRLGIGYEFELGSHWDFAPEFLYDLKDGNINAFTIAVGVGRRF